MRINPTYPSRCRILGINVQTVSTQAHLPESTQQRWFLQLIGDHLLQCAAVRHYDVKTSCNLQRPTTKRGNFPATCSDLSRRRETFLQSAATRHEDVKPSCNLQRPVTKAQTGKDAHKTLIFSKTKLITMNSIHLNQLRNIEFSQFISDYLQIIASHDPKVMRVQAEYDALKSSSDILIQLLKPEQGNALTKDLESADARRDAAITGLSTIVSGLTYHYDETIKAHAEKLNRQIDLYGAGIARQNYQEQTGSLTSLVSDIKSKTEMTAAVAALNLTDWITELETSNVTFRDLYLERNKSIAHESPESVKEKRNAMMNEYYALRDMIVAHNTIQKGAAPFTAVITELNSIIDSYNQILDKRQRSGADIGSE